MIRTLRQWLKKYLLPFENPAHPLYADPDLMRRQRGELTPEEIEQENAEYEAMEAEQDEKIRQIFGEGFLRQLRDVQGR